MITMLVAILMFAAFTYVIWFVAALTVLFKLAFFVGGLFLSILVATSIGERVLRRLKRTR